MRIIINSSINGRPTDTKKKKKIFWRVQVHEGPNFIKESLRFCLFFRLYVSDKSQSSAFQICLSVRFYGFHVERRNRTKTFRLQRGTRPRSLRRIGLASFLCHLTGPILNLMRNVENFDKSFTLICSKINSNEMCLIKVDTETSWFPVTSGNWRVAVDTVSTSCHEEN